MNTATLYLFAALVTITLIGGMLQLFFVVRERQRRQKWQERRAVALVVGRFMEPGFLSDRWYLILTWIDGETGQKYTFPSPPFTSRPPHQVGDSVRIAFNQLQPEQLSIIAHPFSYEIGQ